MTRKQEPRKRRRRPQVRVQPGAAPGTLPSVDSTEKARVHVLAFGPDGLVEKRDASLEDVRALRAKWPTVWANIDNVRDTRTLTRLQEQFGLHLLAVEDVVNVGQRPKLDPYDEHLFLVLGMPPADDRPIHEQVSMFVGEGYVLTFQEREGDCFEPVRERLRGGKIRIRTSGPGYLAYALIDAVIDSYFPLLDRIGERLESLEDQVLGASSDGVPEALQRIRADLRELRRWNLPQRDVVSALSLPTTPYVNDETRLFLRDCLDHAERVSDLADAYREESSDLMHLHMAGISNKMNEVMKVLTIMAAIFIPLSFIAGVYGMNFSADSPWNMPELNWRWGYPAVLGLMAAVALGLLLFFKKRRWF